MCIKLFRFPVRPFINQPRNPRSSWFFFLFSLSSSLHFEQCSVRQRCIRFISVSLSISLFIFNFRPLVFPFFYVELLILFQILISYLFKKLSNLDEMSDPCECFFDHESAMQRLLAMVRTGISENSWSSCKRLFNNQGSISCVSFTSLMTWNRKRELPSR